MARCVPYLQLDATIGDVDHFRSKLDAYGVAGTLTDYNIQNATALSGASLPGRGANGGGDACAPAACPINEFLDNDN